MRCFLIVVLAGIALSAPCALAQAQNSVPLLEPKPTFVPGMYESEARNSAFKNHPVTSKTCVASADYDAFRDETMAQYLKDYNVNNPKKDCTVSDIKSIKNGFAFALACSGTKTLITHEFGKEADGTPLVRSTIQTLIKAAPKYSSSILIMMRRVGDCPGQTSAKAL
jgi:Protein of unknown function (DUF3617)